MLQVAAAHGHRTLVLGAWGCGVFGNDPVTVANSFAEALREVDQFDRVAFAIRDGLPNTPVYTAFGSTLIGADRHSLSTVARITGNSDTEPARVSCFSVISLLL